MASAAEGAPTSSAGAGAGGGCGCGPSSGEAAGGTDAADDLTAQRTPASPDALASFRFDLLVAADGASSLTRQVLQRYDKELAVRLTRDTSEISG